MKFLGKIFGSRSESAAMSSALLVGACFLLGALAGCLIAANGGDSATLAEEANWYTTVERASFVSVAVNIFKYPLLVFVCGLSAFGVILIPVTMGVKGFFLSFSVTTFVRLFGSAGLAFSASLFGVQCLLVFPCLMFFATQGLMSSSTLFSFARGGGKKLAGHVFTGTYFLRSLICLAALLLCVFLDTFVTPVIASWVGGIMLI